MTAVEDKKADVYIMYCINAASARKKAPQPTVARIPEELNVRSA